MTEHHDLIPKYTKIRDTYTIDDFLGAGAFGSVYKARHKYMGLQALKIFNPGSISKDDEAELFHEAYILSKLTHENVVRVYEANTFIINNMRYCYIAMEYVSGCSLEQYIIEEVRLSLAQALEIQKGICSGLAQAHKLEPPVVHRDIKPQNVMISKSNNKINVKVSDFGLAKHVDVKTRLAESGGTLAYMPPEGFWNYVSPASDVFSAGIIFYLILTGVAPFKMPSGYIYTKNSDIQPVIIESRNKKPERPSKYNEKLDDDIDEIVLKSLEPDLRKRYQNGDEFLQAINQYITMRDAIIHEDIKKALDYGKQYSTLKQAIEIMEKAISGQSKDNAELLISKYGQILNNWKKGVVM